MEKSPTPFQKVIQQDRGMKYADMTSTQKATFIAKVVVCVCTFGFVFPNVQND